MDEQKLREWQELHLRHVNEEPLTEAELTAYQAGCDELGAEDMEILNRNGNEQTRKIEQQLAKANAETQRLRDREKQQLARIAELEDKMGLFRFQIEEVIHLKHTRPTLLIGRLLSGVIKDGDWITVPLKDGSVVRGFVVNLEANYQEVSHVSAAECKDGMGIAVARVQGLDVALGIAEKCL